MKNKIAKVIDKRPGKWPKYYDEKNVENYQEYFIKGTNIKLGFCDNNLEEGCEEFCCIISEIEDDFIWFDTEKDLFEHFEYILMNKDFGWKYFY